MRWSLTWTLLALAAWSAAAQENEAEKLFRSMEQKVRKAKTLQFRFDATMIGAGANADNLKGTLTLGEGDKLRMEVEGKQFGTECKLTFTSDGTDLKSFGYTKAPGRPKQDRNETQKSPKGIGAYFRGAQPREGFFLCLLKINGRFEPAPDDFKISDFKLAGEEKLGKRNTQVIQYTVKDKDANLGSMKVWLDAKTKLPVKLVMTADAPATIVITETYSEFTIDANVDAKLFELRK